ncbi:hypothetical protein HGP14_16340 [Rhizobium sp. P32RR-XVIII]|uniref:hypothetical protein n=1 Tax=Rhizobium sp. P32RR-XVIII TaxID=2726738 RepID=UPI0014571945|nr:hypothetical protein [Rhizobium sp. P32RR-XVIII]NLS04914.1 hypothetical protein [Rhizobium sp. P32RR-XVIII]
MERIEPQEATTEAATQVWSVTEFCARHRLDTDEEARLLLLFGPFATAFELLHNARRTPRWR